MKTLLTILMIGHAFASGYSFFGIMDNNKAIVIDSNKTCVVFNGESHQCSIEELSKVLYYSQFYEGDL